MRILIKENQRSSILLEKILVILIGVIWSCICWVRWVISILLLVCHNINCHDWQCCNLDVKWITKKRKSGIWDNHLSRLFTVKISACWLKCFSLWLSIYTKTWIVFAYAFVHICKRDTHQPKIPSLVKFCI